jgi:hypothetical protein
MEQASSFLVNHLHRNISKTIHDMNNIPIGMCIIHHEPFEIGVCKTKPKHHLVQFCPHDTLKFCEFILHVINCNGEHFAIHRVVNTTSHGGPFLNTHDMIKHQPTILQITTRLHALHQINPTCWPITQHFKQKHFLPNHLSMETTILDVVIRTPRLKEKYVIHGASSTNIMLKGCNEVLNVGKTKGLELSISLLSFSP